MSGVFSFWPNGTYLLKLRLPMSGHFTFTTGIPVAMPSMQRLFRQRLSWQRLLRGRLGRFTLLAPAVGLAVLAACGETTVNAPLAAGNVAAVGGAGQRGVVGQVLPDDIQVRVLGSDSQPLSGAQVVFSVTAGGGTVAPAAATADANGIARTRWTLGRTAGANVLTATAGSATTTIAATASAGRASIVAGAAGDNQTAVANSAVTIPPSVRVSDANGNPVEGVAVTFSVASGGGRVTDGLRRTNTLGVATVGSWILGPATGTQTLTVRVEESGVTNSPILFAATATAGSVAQMTAASVTSQTAVVGTAVAAPPSVRVGDANGNPVANEQVTFRVTVGNGQLTGSSQLSNAQGIATVGSWILGSGAGAQQVIADVTGATSVVFAATAIAGAATQLVVIAGNNQRAQITRTVPIAPSVVVRDALGNSVSGVVVTFAVASGGGSVVGGRQVTDASGTAQVGGWFLGDVPGTNTLTASAPGVSPVTFTAIAEPGRPVSMVANSSVAQSAIVDSPVLDPPSVLIRDIGGNPVAGVVVTFAVTAGGGSVVGSLATTNVAGVATLTSWTVGVLTGTNSVVATATGLPNVTFFATAAAGAAANVEITAGDNQVAVQGTALLARPSVRVTDSNGNLLSGATVTFAVTSGLGSISGVTQVTDAAGIAAVGSWTLGPAAPNTLTATVTGSGISGNPVTFTAQSVTEVSLLSPLTSPILLGTTFVVTVGLLDAAASPAALAGVTLTIAIASGGGTLNGTLTAVTNGSGAATFTLNVTGAIGARTFRISGTGLTPAITAAITFN